MVDVLLKGKESFIKPEDILLIRLYSDKIKERYMSTSSVTFSHIYEKMGEREKALFLFKKTKVL